jgi:hypothetical protein
VCAGANVIITIFGDLDNFYAKKLAIFLKGDAIIFKVAIILSLSFELCQPLSAKIFSKS